jgi:tetratricopeptide (TPR) repeat protein
MAPSAMGLPLWTPFLFLRCRAHPDDPLAYETNATFAQISFHAPPVIPTIPTTQEAGMNRRWGYSQIGMIILGCLIYACSPQKPPTDIPITTGSEEARVLYLQGRDKLENAELEKAAALFDRALQKDPKFALAYIFRSASGGGSTVALENRNKALALIGTVTPGEQLLIKYLAAQANQQTAQVKHCLDSLLVAFPMDKRVQMLEGLYYRSLGDLKTAVTYYEKAVSLDSTYAPPYNLLGYDNLSLGNPGVAEKAFKTYMRLLPTLPNPVDSYAEFLRLQGRYDESIAQYKKVLEIDPSFTSSISGIGDCYLCRGDGKQAREYYREYIGKTLQINSKLGGYYSLAATYVGEGNIPEALKALEERRELAIAQKQYGSAVNSLAYEGYLLSSFGKPQEGLKKYDEAIALAKTASMPERARENLLFWSNYWLAYAHAQAKSMQTAKECLAAFSKDIERRGNPGEPDALKGAQGYLAVMEGRYDDGIQLLTSIPDDPSKLYALAFAYTKKGDKENAGRMIEKLRRWEGVTLDNAVNLRLALALAKK